MKRGFTLVEVTLVVAIVIIVSVALLNSFMSCLALNETSRNITIAMNIARDKMEELVNKRLSWDEIIDASYNEAALVAAYGFHGSCNVRVIPINDKLKSVRIVVCWRQRGNRILGEDRNLNGVLDSGEDINPVNTQLDSPVVVETAIVKPI
jgi:prepilin-type N-terminal cleavage/methylation domain-containing protein